MERVCHKSVTHPLNISTQLSLSSELTVALLETEQGSQATVYTRETHEGKTQESCCYHDNGDNPARHSWL